MLEVISALVKLCPKILIYAQYNSQSSHVLRIIYSEHFTSAERFGHAAPRAEVRQRLPLPWYETVKRFLLFIFYYFDNKQKDSIKFKFIKKFS